MPVSVYCCSCVPAHLNVQAAAAVCVLDASVVRESHGMSVAGSHVIGELELHTVVATSVILPWRGEEGAGEQQSTCQSNMASAALGTTAKGDRRAV